MFLAYKELLKEKAKFALITFVILLVGYLTFFLTSLAYGLATSYTLTINAWGANAIILDKNADNNLARSLIFERDYQSIFKPETMALLGFGATTVETSKPTEVAIFGIDMNSFIAPKITEGRAIQTNDELVVSSELKQNGINIGDRINLQRSSSSYKVVGFTEEAKFQAQPLIYSNIETWRQIVAEGSGMTAMKDTSSVSAIVLKQPIDVASLEGTKLGSVSLHDFIFSLPGYQAQVLTFSLMIGSLVVITSFVLAIFMYILTLQKVSIFGVLKAEGIPNSYLASSVVFESIVLALVGLSSGFVLTLLTNYTLPSGVPFTLNYLFFALVAALFILFTVVGSLFSVRAITKIDPIKAIK